MSKLQQFTERLIEAGWLVALVTVPLYFDVYSSRVFEPDKITLLRCLVLTMLVAQLVAITERSQRRTMAPEASIGIWNRWRATNPLLIPTVVFVVAESLATLTSIDPLMSVFGSYQRLQGTYTLLTYVALFFLVAVNLRTHDQLNRLLNVVLVTSIPVSTYGIAQHLHLDPLPWGGDVVFRVTSTMGNAIFLAAYLIMIVPFAAARLLTAVQRARDSSIPEGKSVRPIVLSWTVLIAIQNVSLAALLILHSAVFGIWWAATGVVGLFAVLAATQPRQMPTRRLARVEAIAMGCLLILQIVCIFLTQSRGPWLGLVAAALVFILLAELRSASARRLLLATLGVFAIIGCVLVVFNLPNSPLARFRSVPYVGRLGQLSDVKDGTGRVRVLIWQGTYALLTTRPDVGFQPDPLGVARLVVGYGPETMHEAYNKVYPPALGDLESRNASPDRNHNDFLDHLVMEGIIGLLAYVFLLIAAVVLGWKIFRKSAIFGEAVLVAGLVAAIFAHVTETQTGIAIVSTKTYFWLCLALLVVLSTRGEEIWKRSVPLPIAGGAPPASRSRRAGKRGGRPVAMAVVASRPGMAWGSRRIVGIAVYAAIFVFGQAMLSLASVSDARVLTYATFLWLVLALPTWAWIEGWHPPFAVSQSRATWVVVSAILLTVVGIALNLNQIAADVYHKQGTLFDSQGQYADSTYAYEQAISLAPTQAYYYLFLGRAYLEVAKGATATPLSPPFQPTLQSLLTITPATVGRMGRIDALRSAEIVLLKARDLEPLNPDHYANLARLYRLWGDSTDKSKLADASKYYQQATTLSPHSAQLYSEWTMTSLDQGQTSSALTEAQRAVALDPQFALTHVVLGDVYLAEHKDDPALQEHLKALELDPLALSDSSFEARINQYISDKKAQPLVDRYRQLVQRGVPRQVKVSYAFLLARSGDLAAAERQYLQLVQSDPTDWLSGRNLALTYAQQGNAGAAVAAAQAALKYAPANQQASLQQLISSYQGAKK